MTRPRISLIGRRTKPYSIKLTDAQKMTLRKLGGPPWLRAQLDKEALTNPLCTDVKRAI